MRIDRKIDRTLGALALTTLALVWAGPAGAAPCGTENLVAGKKPQSSKDLKGDLALITDEAVGPEGTQWDAPVGVTFDTPAGQVTYDLGEAHQISAIFLQADANDTYKVVGSVDGTPASFLPLVELPNVVARGHGLRTRAVDVAPTIVRYLRVGEASGDGFYSIAEFAAYCKKPSPFPPTMRVVAAPSAQVTEAPVAAPAKDGGRSVVLLAMAALGLAWLAYRTVNRGGGGAAPGGPAGGAPPLPGEGETNVPSGTAEAAPEPDKVRSNEPEKT